MTQKLLRLLIILKILLLLPIPVKAQPETILEEINRTGLLKVGIREDAVPFGYRDLNNNLSGLCLDFIYILREELKRKLNQEAILVKLYKSTLFNRFELVGDGIIYLECGPNTIRQIDDFDVTFSSSFFVTGTQFLINQENQRLVNPNGSLNGVTIGVLNNTSNQQLVTKRYPEAELVEFQGVTGRFRGVQALQAGKVEAFASDGILLIGEAILQGLNLGENYLLVPENPLDCEQYGMILPANQPEWTEFINSVIKTAKDAEIFSKWFGVILPRIESVENYCRNQNSQP